MTKGPDGVYPNGVFGLDANAQRRCIECSELLSPTKSIPRCDRCANAERQRRWYRRKQEAKLFGTAAQLSDDARRVLDPESLADLRMDIRERERSLAREVVSVFGGLAVAPFEIAELIEEDARKHRARHVVPVALRAVRL